MLEIIAEAGVEVILGIMTLIAVLVGVIWRKLEIRITENKTEISDTNKEVVEARVQLAEIKAWKDGHTKADDIAHSEMKGASETTGHELGLLRVEIREQHTEVANKLSSNSGALHEKLDDLAKSVNQLIGVEKARQTIQKAS